MVKSFYAVVPTYVLFNPNIDNYEKLVFALMTTIVDDSGFGKLSNKDILSIIGTNKASLTPSTISRWVEKLECSGYIRTEPVKYHNGEVIERNVWLHGIPKQDVVKEEEQPKSTNGNGTVSKENREFAHKVIRYVNKLTGKNFRTTTEPYVKTINARIKDGYRELDDYFKIVEAKSVNDFYIKNPHFFAPTTLFARDKFDKNLQAWKPEIREALRVANAEIVGTDLELGEEEF